MDLENILVNTGVIGVISALAPFFLPFLYKLLQKIFKREITKEEKRMFNTALAFAISGVVLVVNFEFVGDWKQDIAEFLQFFFINFAIIKGIVQTIYETLVKGIEVVDDTLAKVVEVR